MCWERGDVCLGSEEMCVLGARRCMCGGVKRCVCEE